MAPFSQVSRPFKPPTDRFGRTRFSAYPRAGAINFTPGSISGLAINRPEQNTFVFSGDQTPSITINPSVLELCAASFTLVLRLRVPTASIGGYQVWVGKGNSASGGGRLFNAGGAPGLSYGSDAQFYGGSNTALTADTWQTVVFALDVTNTRTICRVSGTQVATSVTISGTPATTTNTINGDGVGYTGAWKSYGIFGWQKVLTLGQMTRMESYLANLSF